MEENLVKQFSSLEVAQNNKDNLGPLMASYGSNVEIQHDNDADDNQQDFHDESAANCNLIVNYLPHDIDDTALRDLFAPYGEILMTKVVRDKNSKKSLGYGFVKFLKEDDAVFAIDKMNGFSLGHKNLKVSIARPPSLEIRNCKLYVTNLPKEYTEREVVSLFKEFGDIIECRVLKDRNSRSNKGVAFVQFNLKAQANSALSLNGCQLEGSSRGLVVKYAEDQHKKKELSRLHTLAGPPNGGGNHSSNGNGGGQYGARPLGAMGASHGYGINYAGGNGGPHVGGAPRADMQGNGGGGRMRIDGGGNGYHGPNSDNHYSPPHLQQPPPPPQGYYYQQQQGLNPYDGGMGSPLLLMSPLNSPQLSVYLPGGMGVGGPLDYSPSNHQGRRGRKAFPLDTSLAEQQHQRQQQHLQQQQAAASGGWFGSMPPHLAFLNSPQLGHPQQLSPLGGLTPLGMSLMGSPTVGGHGLMRGHPVGSPLDSPLQQQAAAMGAYSGSVTLNICSLPAQADVALLHDLFSPYGRILSAQIDVDTAAQNRGAAAAGASRVSVCSGRGRVQMAGLPQAEYAAQALNGAVITDDGVPIQVSLSYH